MQQFNGSSINLQKHSISKTHCIPRPKCKTQSGTRQEMTNYSLNAQKNAQHKNKKGKDRREKEKARNKRNDSNLQQFPCVIKKLLSENNGIQYKANPKSSQVKSEQQKQHRFKSIKFSLHHRRYMTLHLEKQEEFLVNINKSINKSRIINLTVDSSIKFMGKRKMENSTVC